MSEAERMLFYYLCIFLGIFWAVIESVIAYWLYQIYKLIKKIEVENE
jgi:cell division septal protein FtsQ